MAIAYKSTLATSGGLTIDTLTVTTMPSTTSYTQGDTLDTTGLIVTATAGSMSGDVTSNCVITPTVLNTVGTQVITVAYGTHTTTFNVTVTAAPAATIYGAKWYHNQSNSAWVRTDDAASFSDPVPAVNNGNGSSPFDGIAPWSGMRLVQDSEAGTLVEIPKFYYKWTSAADSGGTYTQLQISATQFTGSFVSPAHMDRGDGHGERSIVYVGAYDCAENTYRSDSGEYPPFGGSRSTFRSGIHALGSTIWQWDWAMYWTICMLYLVEYADWNSQAKIGMGCGDPNEGDVMPNGMCDSMVYHTGTNVATRNDYGYVRYRYIENLWANVYDWVDGIYFSGTSQFHNTCNFIKNPANFSDDTGGRAIASSLPTSSGLIMYWNFTGNYSGYEYALVPTIVTSVVGNYDTYCCDYFKWDGSGTGVMVGGYYEGSPIDGLFHFHMAHGDPSLQADHSSRLMKLP